MSYGDNTLKQGCRGDTPGGRSSWQDAQNQLRGYLEWANSFLEPEKIIEKLVEIRVNKLQEECRSSVEEHIRFLKQTRAYHREMDKQLSNRLDRAQELLAEEDEFQADRDPL